MTPRIRSLFSGPLVLNRARKPPQAPTVFREFVAALERLEAKPNGRRGRQRPRAAKPSQGDANGHARPTARRIRRGTR